MLPTSTLDFTGDKCIMTRSFKFWASLVTQCHRCVVAPPRVYDISITHNALNHRHIGCGWSMSTVNRITLAVLPAGRPSWCRRADIPPTSLLATLQLTVTRLDVTTRRYLSTSYRNCRIRGISTSAAVNIQSSADRLVFRAPREASESV